MKFKRIHIELTNRCNFACEFCPQSIMTRKCGDIEFQLLESILDQIHEARLTETVLFHVMGEPLLYPYLEKAVRYAKQKGLRVCLTTNGWLMDKEILEALFRNNIDHIILSLQTPDAGSFELKKSKIDFKEYRKKIIFCVTKALNDNIGTKITLSFLVTPLKNILLPSKKISIIDTREDMLKHLISWIKEIANNTIETQAVKIMGRLGEIERNIKRWNIFGWNLSRITDNFMLETRLLGDWIHPGLYSDKIYRAHVGSCEGLKEHFGILWNGDMVFCCVDFDGKTAFGNAKDTKIKDALQRKEVQKIIKGFKGLRILHPYCQRCLGDVSLKKSLVRQIGSVLYFKFYRRWWERKRSKASLLVK